VRVVARDACRRIARRIQPASVELSAWRTPARRILLAWRALFVEQGRPAPIARTKADSPSMRR
jgi:hypothetical protein